MWATLAAHLLSACGAMPAVVAPAAAVPPVQLGVMQVGNGVLTRYVYCEANACPAPTLKTPPEPVAAVSLPANGNRIGAEGENGTEYVDVTFGFNSSDISQRDKSRLTQAAGSHADTGMEITARSDFVGPPEGQHKILLARARAMRSIVAKQAPGTRITARREIAEAHRVPAAEQARQRRGTVRFILPIDATLKGTTQ